MDLLGLRCSSRGRRAWRRTASIL